MNYSTILEKNERIVWIGKPLLVFASNIDKIFGFVFGGISLTIGLFIAILTIKDIFHDFTELNDKIIQLFIGILFIANGFHLTFIRFVTMRRKKQITTFILTNQRILILNKNKIYKEEIRKPIQDVIFINRNKPYGSILFGSEIPRFDVMNVGYIGFSCFFPICFYDLPLDERQKVYNLVNGRCLRQITKP